MLFSGSQIARVCTAHEHLVNTVRWVETNQIHPTQKAGTQLVPKMKSRQSKPGRARLHEIIKQNRRIYLPWKPARVKSKADGRHLEEIQAGWVAFRQIKDFAKEYIFHLAQRGSPTTHVGFKWWHMVQVSRSSSEETAQRLVTTPAEHSEGCDRAEPVLLKQKVEPWTLVTTDGQSWFFFFF